jgi:hypothetical protein
VQNRNYRTIVFSFSTTLFFKPFQGLRVNPYRVFGVVGAKPLHGAEPHIRKALPTTFLWKRKLDQRNYYLLIKLFSKRF